VSSRRPGAVANKFGDADRSHLTGLSMHALTELAAPSTPPEIREEIEREIVNAAEARCRENVTTLLRRL
jgi:hypothetical protein